MWYFANSRTSVMSSINREKQSDNIGDEHQSLLGLEEKNRPHMQIFDTEEKDKKRQVPLP
jgi:hypothetical protein